MIDEEIHFISIMILYHIKRLRDEGHPVMVIPAESENPDGHKENEKGRLNLSGHSSIKDIHVSSFGTVEGGKKMGLMFEIEKIGSEEEDK